MAVVRVFCKRLLALDELEYIYIYILHIYKFNTPKTFFLQHANEEFAECVYTLYLHSCVK